MGNFSRNTFDVNKRYSAVRLQQGVPLVDADWNELQDVTRNELYTALLAVMPSVLSPSMLLTGAGNNDLQLNTGIAIALGRPAHIPNPLKYSTQRYANPATAAADGVQPTPPLTTPNAPRVDLVMLDVFEREVGSAEDPSIINSAIGVETAVRLRRELVLRVFEGGAGPPIQEGHAAVTIATIARPAGVAAITNDMIDDIAPRNPARPFEDVSYPPFFQPASVGSSPFPPWVTSFVASTIVALKPANTSAFGMLPVSFPNGSRIRTMRFRGLNAGGAAIAVALQRLRLDNGQFQTIVQDQVGGTAPFDRLLTVNQSTGLSVVNTQQFSYFVQASTSTTAGDAQLHGFTFRYNV